MDRFIAALAERIESGVPPAGRTLVAIDGRGGSGKTTLAEALARCLAPRVATLGVDGFFKPVAEWRALHGSPIPHLRWDEFSAVLSTLHTGEAARYRPYDWVHDRLGNEVEVRSEIVLVEGLFSMRHDVLEIYDQTVWVEAKLDSRMNRVVERDGTRFIHRWHSQYLPLEQSYVENEEPWRRADIVFAGAELPLSELRTQLLVGKTGT